MNGNRKIQYFRFVIAYNVVMLIPLALISFCVLYLFHKQQQQKINDEMVIVMERQEEFWKEQMSVIRGFNNSCRYDKKYHEEYSVLPENYIDIQRELSKQEENFTFVDGIYLYSKGTGTVISSGGNIEEGLFFSEICKMEQAVFDEEDVDITSAYSAYLRADNKPGIVLVNPVKTYGTTGIKMKYLLYTIKNEKLSVQFGTDKKGDTTVISYNGNVLYMSGNWNPEDWETKNTELLNSGKYYVFRRNWGMDLT